MVSLVAAYFLIAILLSVLSTNPDSRDCSKREEFFVVSNGIHLDLIFHVTEIKKEWLEKLRIPSSAEYVSFGWGDEAFYLNTPAWSDLELGIAIKALFMSSPSALHVDHYSSGYERWHRASVCQNQFETLKDYVFNTFEMNSGNKVILIDFPGYTNTDKFYRAKGSFTLINTCNNWVNTGFKEAGIKTSIWSPFEFGVMYHLKKNYE